MVIGILKEESPEKRVVMLPESVASLKSFDVTVLVEQGAGAGAYASDDDYELAGAQLVSRKDLLERASMILQINPPTASTIQGIAEGSYFLASFNPMFEHETVTLLANRRITSFSLDIIPRTSRAQSMDILSSMATVAGYKAVLTAANLIPRFFPMFMTAAGTIIPAKVLILGAGVAGLQAVATSRKLGAVVFVFDVRSAVKEEVTGLGAKFIEVEGAREDRGAGGYAVEQTEEFRKKQLQAIHEQAVKSDVIICTAQIPGKAAPLLIKKETVAMMRPGSVIIDLAASTGGNCEVTQPDTTVVFHQISVVGNSFFAVDMPSDASKMYGRNVLNFLRLMFNNKGGFDLNWNDDLIKGTCVTHAGNIVNERVIASMKK